MRVLIGFDQSNGLISQWLNLVMNIRGLLMLVMKQRFIFDVFRLLEVFDDDNWDNDFVFVILFMVFYFLYIKGQDNFGGLLFSDWFKVFVFIDSYQDLENWDDNFEGELLMIKGLKYWFESFDVQEQMIWLLLKKSSDWLSEKYRRQRSRDSRVLKLLMKQQLLGNNGKFELLLRLDLLYWEQLGDNDYLDLFVDNEGVFDRRLGVVKVCFFYCVEENDYVYCGY